MDKIKYVKLRNDDGSYTESIPLAVDSDHVDINGGTLTNVMATKANVSDVNSSVSTLTNAINVQKERIDNIIALPEGSTTGDAELIDGRTDYEGHTYSTIGDNIRESTEKKVDKTGFKQITYQNTEFFQLGKNKFDGIWHSGFCQLDGSIHANDPTSDHQYNYSNLIPVEEGKKYLTCTSLPANASTRVERRMRFVTVYDENQNALPNLGIQLTSDGRAYLNGNEIKFVRITVDISMGNLNQLMVELENAYSVNRSISYYSPYQYILPLTEIENGTMLVNETELKNNYLKYVIGINKLNPDEAVWGFINDNNGTIVNSSSYKTSDFIFMQAGQTINITPRIRKFLAYTENYIPISNSYVGEMALNYSYEAEEDCYIRFSYYASDAAIMAYFGTEPITDYQPFSKELPEDTNVLNLSNDNRVSMKIYNEAWKDYEPFFTKNLTNEEITWAEGTGFWDWSPSSNNIIVQSLSDATHGTVNCLSKTKYYISGVCYELIRVFLFQGVSGKVWTLFPTVVNQNDPTIYPYENVFFVAPEDGVLYINKYKSNAVSVKKFINFSNVIIDEESIIDELYNRVKYRDVLYNKNYCACGDSFTAGDFAYSDEEYVFPSGKYQGQKKVYPYIIGDRCDMNITNLAVGGMTLTDVRPTNSFTYQEIYKNIPANTNYITLKFGINDGHQSAPIGEITDTGITTFYGAWNTVMTYLIEHFPNARIGIIVSNGLDHVNYANATIAIAKKYGIPYLNEATGENEPLLNRSLRTDVDSSIKTARNNYLRVAPNSTYPDNTNSHPNVKCHYIESEMVEAFLRRI